MQITSQAEFNAALKEMFGQEAAYLESMVALSYYALEQAAYGNMNFCSKLYAAVPKYRTELKGWFVTHTSVDSTPKGSWLTAKGEEITVKKSVPVEARVLFDDTGLAIADPKGIIEVDSFLEMAPPEKEVKLFDTAAFFATLERDLKKGEKDENPVDPMLLTEFQQWVDSAKVRAAARAVNLDLKAA